MTHVIKYDSLFYDMIHQRLVSIGSLIGNAIDGNIESQNKILFAAKIRETDSSSD